MFSGQNEENCVKMLLHFADMLGGSPLNNSPFACANDDAPVAQR